MAGLPGDHNKVNPDAKDHERKGYFWDPSVNFMLSKEDGALLQCPYEKSHRILQSKMLKHLVRCRGNYMKNSDKNKIKISVCMFDFLHHVPTEELQAHENACPTYLARLNQEQDDKDAFVIQMQTLGLDAETVLIKQKINRDEFEERRLKESAIGLKLVTEESWETEALGDVPAAVSTSYLNSEKSESKPVFTGYDPRKKINEQRHKLLLNPQGLTKAERREHRYSIAEWTLDESPEIPGSLSPRKRNIRVPVGYSAWAGSNREQSAKPSAQRFDHV